MLLYWCQVHASARWVLGEGDTRTLVAARNLGITLSLQGGHAAAERLLRATAGRQAALLGVDHCDTLRTAVLHAQELQALGRHSEAAPLLCGMRARVYRAFGAEHPYTLQATRVLAQELATRGGGSAASTDQPGDHSDAARAEAEARQPRG